MARSDPTSLAQEAVDTWVTQYTDRPHQGLDQRLPVTPAERFAPVPADQWDVLELWLPPALIAVSSLVLPGRQDHGERLDAGHGGGIEFDKVVPPSGNITIAGQQFWLGPLHAGKTVHLWGRPRRGPPDDRCGPGQDRPLPPQHRRPGPAAHPGRRAGRRSADSPTRTGAGHRSRARRVPNRVRSLLVRTGCWPQRFSAAAPSGSGSNRPR